MEVSIRNSAACAAGAAAAFAIFYALGMYVTQHGEPAVLWSFAQAVRGHALGIAWGFTTLCYPYVLAPLSLGCIVLAIVNPRWRVPVLTILVVMLLSWRGADLFQHVFARPRRADWLVKHELSFSYPSSHASIAIGFYFYWGITLLRSGIAKWLRVTAFSALTVVTFAIMWSRLALAAHYPADLLGGALLGAALILLAEAALCAIAASRLSLAEKAVD